MGVLEDTVFIVTSVFASAIMLGLGYYAITTLGAFGPLASPTATIVEQNFTYLDGLIAFGMVLLFCAAVTLAYFLPTHPAFFFTFLLTAFIAFIITPLFSNIYAKIATIPLLASSFATFPLAALVIGNLPLITFLLSGVIAVVSYGKKFAGPQYAELG